MNPITILILGLALVLVALVSAVVYLRIRARNLAQALASALAVADEWSALLALEHTTNYAMACTLYGKSAVDRAIRRAHDKGVS